MLSLLQVTCSCCFIFIVKGYILLHCCQFYRLHVDVAALLSLLQVTHGFHYIVVIVTGYTWILLHCCHCSRLCVDVVTLLSLFQATCGCCYIVVIVSGYLWMLLHCCHCFRLPVDVVTLLSLFQALCGCCYIVVIVSGYLWMLLHCCHCSRLRVDVVTLLSLLQATCGCCGRRRYRSSLPSTCCGTSWVRPCSLASLSWFCSFLSTVSWQPSRGSCRWLDFSKHYQHYCFHLKKRELYMNLLYVICVFVVFTVIFMFYLSVFLCL